MSKTKKIIKTASGIFAAKVAKDLFKASGNARTAKEKIALDAGASLVGSASFHLLKDDVAELAEIVGGKRKALKE